MLNDTIEFRGIEEVIDEDQLALSRAKSEVNEQLMPDVHIYFGTDENLAELFDETVFLRPCGCELHFNEASFDLFECKAHENVTIEISN